MKQRKPKKTWEKTRLQNLVRHKSGRYYARAFAGGKEVWKSLKTSHFSVAGAKLAEFLVLPHLARMQPDAVLKGIHEIEKYDRMARRNFGLGDSAVGGSLNVNVLTNQALVQVSRD